MINKISCFAGNTAPLEFVDLVRSLGAFLIMIHLEDDNYLFDIYVKDDDYLSILDICLDYYTVVSVTNSQQNFEDDFDMYLHQMNNFRKLYERRK